MTIVIYIWQMAIVIYPVKGHAGGKSWSPPATAPRSICSSRRGASMPNDIVNVSVAAFLRGHGILAELLRKAEANAAERKIPPTVLLTARLFPDMFPLTGQVQGACDTAKRTIARLVGVEAPRFEDNEASFAELHARIRKTTAFVESHPVGAIRVAAASM